MHKAPAKVEVNAQDVLSTGVVFCPNPKMPVWSHHPRIFIDVVTSGEGSCPYCSTVYTLKPGEVIGSH